VKFRPFPEAREFANKLGLKTREEWRKWCKSGKKPDDIPPNPVNAYKTQWISWGDWLGTGSVSAYTRTHRPYEEAKEYVRSLGFKNRREYEKWAKSGKKPDDIPSHPNGVYKNEGWINWYDWLGTENKHRRDFKHRKDFLPYEEAKKYVQAHSGAKNQEEYNKWCKSGEKPDFIPATPYSVYENEGWISYADWLGPKLYTKYWPFEKAREYARKLGQNDVEAYKKWHKSENPEGIPRNPDKKYKDEGWVDWYDWLGTEYWPFEKARDYARQIELKSSEEYKEWAKSNEKPKKMLAGPDRAYKNKGWVDWADWLGTGNKYKKDFLPYEEAKKYVQAHSGTKGKEEFIKWHKSAKPKGIPSTPSTTYKNKGWVDWADWLGIEYWPFEKARDYVHKLGLKNVEDWYDWCKSGNRPRYIPSGPDDMYKDEGWVDWYDWLGTEETIWSVKRVKELLRDLIKDNLIYEADDIILYNILYTRGLLNLRDRDRHGPFFKNLLKAVKTPEGRELIEKYANSDSESPPDLSGSGISPDEELATATYRDIEESEQIDPLDSGPIKSVEQIFKEAHRLESYVEDIESMQFHVSHYVQKLWQDAFLNEEEAVSKIRLNGNKYHDAISKTFLLEYDGAKSVNVPLAYAFPKGRPNLMQLLVAYKVKTKGRFGNFSKTGTGKTLSAVLASRVVDSHITVIICPNAVVKQWGEDIEQIFPDSVVKLGKAAFYEKRDVCISGYKL
jgi:hypothetical protein